MEVSDYNFAYHQFNDLLSGWTVDNATLEETNHQDERQRLPRTNIDIKKERDAQDCEKLMKTFGTLCSTARNLY